LHTGYLPLVWAGTLAYYLDYALEEAGLILPVAAATFGIEPPAWLPTFAVDPVVTGRRTGQLSRVPASDRHAHMHL
jgi:hypothetical protein